MTSRFILVLLAMMWSAFAAAAEVVNEPEQNNQWLKPSTQISSEDKNNTLNKQPAGNAQKEQSPKSERSRLGGMFDLLLPSGLRDNQ
ncbi:hypothetical protein GCM10011365_23350 [Marinicella pacifica]|jgi:hypothetical protein|uniref:Uncharacterized protein n=1 Tax=Marinicella pacifica TaxID=1171543 RepID=A0A917CX56_9GAMM|nr:hypothetical protein [Marinicella pacifica]GGG01460.1 hypothetical protein GCM10011365_23350 [Marinicella pacifica]